MLRRRGASERRQGFALHRRQLRTDRWGEQEAVFDMEHPDAVVEDGSADAVLWQSAGQVRSGGRMTGGAAETEQGERYQSVLQGALFSDLALSERDRIVINEAVYELREVQRWPSYRMLYLRRLW